MTHPALPMILKRRRFPPYPFDIISFLLFLSLLRPKTIENYRDSCRFVFKCLGNTSRYLEWKTALHHSISGPGDGPANWISNDVIRQWDGRRRTFGSGHLLYRRLLVISWQVNIAIESYSGRNRKWNSRCRASIGPSLFYRTILNYDIPPRYT